MPVYCLTGANRGLGLEFVRQLSQLPSATIIATTRSNDNDLTDLKAINPSDTSTKIHIMECDIASLDSINSFVKNASSLLESQSLKITHLIANAGVNSVSGQNSLTIGPADLHREIDINLIGPAKLVENLVSQSLLANDVRVLNMTSGLGSMTKSLTIEPRKCMTY
ncbi:NAD(P)-binding protein [Paraphaeosphaeria sporulosa]|uniref:NAD(P)-binding protein n=1 Tax=Paraphaeosphaeria sporulosa TaxID=1460663 RepID=A0A177C1Z8_9PLEO|nr:NAD(P)-binding protein [Paraphaeosphaeria sporulosa]OAG01465.1 NAD(P)-binding protein [Paraphaeosphaeria sporulosa]